MAEDENERSVHSTVLLLLGTFSILRFHHSSVPGIKLRSFATRTNENLLVEKKKTCPHIRISSRQPASRFLTGRGVRSENARDIHEKFTIITRQDAQRIFNGASTGGHPPVFFPPPPPSPLSLTYPRDSSRFWKSSQRVRSREIRRRLEYFYTDVVFAPLFLYARMIILTG